jgi:3-hydroxyisobutyrate dehydrogenase-like beta-hydroxyacid dehydrogenase
MDPTRPRVLAQPEAIPPLQWRIGLVGYGEVGRLLAEDLRGRVARVLAHDVKLGGADERPLCEHAERHGVELVASHAAAAEAADLLISIVTANQTVPAAQACAPAVRRDAWFLDLNSASPGAKRSAASAIDAAGGAYVEAAVMSPFPPHRLRVPILLGGARADELRPHLDALGFNASVASSALGVASATKMCRSVIIKGLEAMVIEGLTAARAYGVESQVLTSLVETFPGIDWEDQATYFFQRVIQHGRRRAEEMVEAARTVEEIGLTPWSAAGTAERQAWVADLADRGELGDRGDPTFARSADWRIEADRILRGLKR